MRACRAPVAAALLIVLTLGWAPAPVRAQSRTYLPDSARLGQVDDRVITVYDFRDRYFSSDHDTRGGTDSLARVDFLKALADREVMSLEAVKAGTRLEPNDELTLKRYENQVLALWIYQTRVIDPVVVTEKDLREQYQLVSFELRLRYLLLPDLTTAEFVRDQLTHGRLTWREAARRYSLGPDSLVDGDLGWKSHTDLPARATAKLFSLRPPGYSEIIRDEDGFRIWQCLDRRRATMPVLSAIRRPLLTEVNKVRQAPLEDKFFQDMRDRAKPVYDTTNIILLADRFREVNAQLGGQESGLDLRRHLPQLSAADTLKVLATANGQKYTFGRFIEAYRDVPPMRRRRLLSPSAVFDMLERMVLEPTIVQYAREQGLEKTPRVLAEMRRTREGMLVGHFYDDSVEARLVVDPQERRSYYQKHLGEYISRERVRYAVVARKSEAGADSVMARFAKGETPQAILAADSASGWRVGFIKEAIEGQAHTFHNILFEELRQGQSTKIYLGGDHVWGVFYILQHEMPRPMAYAEVADIVAESVENQASEKIFDAMLVRLRKRHRIQLHPELVMRVQLSDPAADMNLPSGD